MCVAKRPEIDSVSRNQWLHKYSEGYMKLTRIQLYEMVWKDPIIKVAAILSLSDVGLAKLCRRHQVPTPIRGYWAKLAAGHTTPKISLEGDHEAMVDIPEPTAWNQQNKLKRQAEKARESRAVQGIGQIQIPEQLENPHWLTRNTQKLFQDVRNQIDRTERRKNKPNRSPNFDALEIWQVEKYGRYECGPHREGFKVAVSLGQVDRALLFLDTLVRELEAREFKIVIDKGPDVYRREVEALKDSEGIKFSLREGYSRVELDREEFKAARKDWPYASEHKYVGNGRFTFALDGRSGWTNREWKDGAKKIEEHLTAIVAEFVDLVPRIKQIRIDKEHEEKKRQERAHAEYLVCSKQKEKFERFEEALKEAEQFGRLNSFEAYLQFLENQYQHHFGLLSQGAIAWFTEMRELATAHNPISRRLDTLRTNSDSTDN